MQKMYRNAYCDTKQNFRTIRRSINIFLYALNAFLNCLKIFDGLNICNNVYLCGIYNTFFTKKHFYYIYSHYIKKSFKCRNRAIFTEAKQFLLPIFQKMKSITQLSVRM